jgi:hypothetical protein
MRKALDYLADARACRKLIRDVKSPLHKKQLKEIATSLEALATTRATKLAKRRGRVQTSN